jgi:hypothetical protein
MRIFYYIMMKKVCNQKHGIHVVARTSKEITNKGICSEICKLSKFMQFSVILYSISGRTKLESITRQF